MGKKQFDSIAVVWLVGAIIGSLLLFALTIFSINNPASEMAYLAYRLVGPLNYGHAIALPLAFSFLWTMTFIIIRKVTNSIKVTSTAKTIANTPEIKIMAKVILKNSTTNSHHPSFQDYVYVYDSLTITFETQNGRRLVFPVMQEQYALYLENDTGILTYKEHNGQLTFVNFERQTQPSN